VSFDPLSPRLPVRAAIFDMDGLLVDSEPCWHSVAIDVLESLGSNVRPIIAQGLTKGRRVDEDVALYRRLTPWNGVGHEVDDEEVVSRIVSGVVSAIETGAVLLPGALEALDHLGSEGLRLALATGSPPLVVDAVLERFSLRERFDVVASAVEVPFGKPHPAVFLETAAALGLDPVECVVLEDSISGCIAGKAAQMRVIAVPAPDDLTDRRFAIADLILPSLEAIDDAEVAELLGFRLEARRSG